MSASFLNGIEISLNKVFKLSFFRKLASYINRQIKAFVFKIYFKKALLPYFAFYKNASKIYKALFSKFPDSYIISAIASLITEICPSLI